MNGGYVCGGGWRNIEEVEGAEDLMTRNIWGLQEREELEMI